MRNVSAAIRESAAMKMKAAIGFISGGRLIFWVGMWSWRSFMNQMIRKIGMAMSLRITGPAGPACMRMSSPATGKKIMM